MAQLTTECHKLHIFHTYVTFSIAQATFIELCMFSDPSVKAIAAEAYLKVIHEDGHNKVGLTIGKAKRTPPEFTIPQLELCRMFYIDSKEVLGYINNQNKRFHVYPNNRVQRIKRSSLPDQMRHVLTEHNPADHGSRSVAAENLASASWLYGPVFFSQS